MTSSSKYPLEQLAIIKQKKLEESEKVLKQRKEALLKEEKKLTDLERERDKVKDHRYAKLQQLREKLDAGTSTDKIQQMKTYLKIVDEQLKAKELKVQEQLKQVDAAKKNVEAARQDYLKRNQDVEKLRLHKEEWKREEYLATERLQGIEGDELGTSMHIRKKRKHKS